MATILQLKHTPVAGGSATMQVEVPLHVGEGFLLALMILQASAAGRVSLVRALEEQALARA